MTQYNMNRFLYMWREKTLEDDVTWRGYHIPNAAKTEYVSFALKALGLNYAGEHALRTFCALYEVAPEDAARVLAEWWVWSRLASGGHPKGVQKRAVEGPLATGGATPPAAKPAPGL